MEWFSSGGAEGGGGAGEGAEAGGDAEGAPLDIGADVGADLRRRDGVADSRGGNLGPPTNRDGLHLWQSSRGSHHPKPFSEPDYLKTLEGPNFEQNNQLSEKKFRCHDQNCIYTLLGGI